MTALDSFLGIFGEISPESEYLVDMSFGGPEIVHFKEAHIATDLVPLADEHLTGASRIRIIGFDGASVSLENYRWTGDLVRWVAQGNQIQYLLLKPTEEAINRLSREAEKLEGASGYLEVMTLDPNRAVSGQDLDLLNRWETFHFISFSEPKQLWVEKSHPKGSVAHGCAYFSPSAAEKAALWDLLTSQYEYVVKTYGKVLIASGNTSIVKQPDPELQFA